MWELLNSIRHVLQEERLSEIQERRLAVQNSPHDPGGYLSLAKSYRDLNDVSAALAVLKEGLSQCPATVELYWEYITRLTRCNRHEEVCSVAHRGSLALSGGGAALMRVVKGLSLPLLYDTPEDIDYHRRRFQSELDALCRETTLETATDRAKAFEAVKPWVNFYLAYQGRNDRNLHCQYGQLLRGIMAANYPQWTVPVSMPPAPSGGKLRVGYVSASFFDHSVMKTHLGWLQEHDKGKVDLYTYHVGEKVDATTQEVERNSFRFSHTPGDVHGGCEAITKDRLHILIFLEIGMDSIMGLLGALRLAPVQCVTWGHPMTSGLDTIDYYLSNSLMEPDDADEHYSERLIRLPGIGICYRKPILPRAILRKTRKDFGLRDDAVLYLSPQAIQKYLPEQDRVFAEIAVRVPAAQFLFMSPNDMVAADLRERLGRTFAQMGLDACQHCVVLPRMNTFDYWNLSLLSDVFLDTMGWSGGITTFEAIACDLAVVTMPGKLMRGRQSYGILTQLGVTDTIATDEASYVDLAVRLGVDCKWRKSVITRMREGFPRLYGDTACVRSLEAFYEWAVAAKAPLENHPTSKVDG